MQVLTAKEHDIGGIFVKRFLPQIAKRTVGPFVFFDQMGPGSFKAGEGVDVRPHPHIGLSTLTYLFEGSLLHRDSLGNHQEIIPGEVNWMTAGRGIVHSERETLEVRAGGHTLHGLQCWVALPEALSEMEPSFTHLKKEELPHLMKEGLLMRLIVGEAYGMSSPIKTYSPMFYLDMLAPAGSKLDLPEGSEVAIYIVSGSVMVGGERLEAGDFALLDDEEDRPEVLEHVRLIMLGGEAFERPPHMFWNFVSFDKARLEQAKEDWRSGRFPTIPGDDKEYIQL